MHDQKASRKLMKKPIRLKIKKNEKKQKQIISSFSSLEGDLLVYNDVHWLQSCKKAAVVYRVCQPYFPYSNLPTSVRKHYKLFIFSFLLIKGNFSWGQK